MTHNEICEKLMALRPGAVWTLRGTTYETLEWLDTPESKPSREELGF